MIYKNNEPYKLTKEEQRMYARRTVYLLMPHFAKWDPADMRVRKPNSFQLEPNYTLFDTESGQSTEVRYARSAPQRKTENGVTFENWNPSYLEFPQSGRMIVEANDPELNFFWANHPANEANPGRNQDRQSIFFPEDLAEKAKQKIAKAKQKHNAITLVLSEREGLDEKGLRMVAATYPDLVQQAGDKNFTVDQLRDALTFKADQDPDLFIRAARSPKTKMNHLVNAAIKEKMLKYNLSKKSWFKIEEEQEKELILAVEPGKDAIETLLDFLLTKDKNNYAGYFEKKLDRTAVFS